MLDSVLKWLLSILILVAYFYLSYIVIGGHIDGSDPNKFLLIGSAYGGLTALAGMVVTYHFGSSKQSADKDKALASMASSMPVQPSTQTVVSTTTAEAIKPEKIIIPQPTGVEP